MNGCFYFSPTTALIPMGLGASTLIVVLHFLMGGIPFGYLAGKIQGVDIRTLGSGNIGATNVFRTLGKKWGTLVFILDFAKAFIPIFLLKCWLGNQSIESTALPADLLLILAGAAVVCGHNFSPYMGFKGGKGMASSAGFIFALFPLSGLVCVLGFGVVFYFSRYVSLGSIVASILLPLSTMLFYREKYWLWALAFFLGAMSIWRHRSNIRRLRAGTESRAGEKTT
jgi:acyl phosphate:glycerol-3-phosphate acyltransferase